MASFALVYRALIAYESGPNIIPAGFLYRC
jgi:hypothetical protein